MDLDQFNQPELPPDPGPPAPGTEPPPQEDQPTKETRRRNGFVARKPHEVREKINIMLLDGVPYGKIPPRLGEDGKDLNEDHIRSWAHGGHEDWLITLERADALRLTREGTTRLLKEQAGAPVQDAARTVAATQLYDLLLSFNPATLANILAGKPELYLRMVNALSRLCEGDAACTHRRAQQTALESKLASKDSPPEKKLLSAGELKDLTREIKII